MVFYEEMVVMTRMSSQNLAKHQHGLVVQRHMYSHGGIVLSGGLSRWVVGMVLEVLKWYL